MGYLPSTYKNAREYDCSLEIRRTAVRPIRAVSPQPLRCALARRLLSTRPSRGMIKLDIYFLSLLYLLAEMAGRWQTVSRGGDVCHSRMSICHSVPFRSVSAGSEGVERISASRSIANDGACSSHRLGESSGASDRDALCDLCGSTTSP